MKYILLGDLESLEEIDDGLYRVAPRTTAGEPAGAELFTEGDLYRVREKAPAGADSIAFEGGDWKYWNSSTGAFYGDVFAD